MAHSVPLLRNFAFLLGLFMGLSGGSVAAESTLRVGKAISGPFDFTPLDIGIAKGFYRQQGLEIEAINFAGSAKLQQALAADAVDIGLGSGPELAFGAAHAATGSQRRQSKRDYAFAEAVR